MWSEFKEMEGTVWGYLIVCERVENDKWGAARFRCVCRCGNETVAAGKTLRKGKKKSCGCLVSEIRTEFNTTEWVGYRKPNARIRNNLYQLWLSMRKRCNSKSSKGKHELN